MDRLKNSIAHFCEKDFQLDYVTKNQRLAPNIVMYLIQRSISRKAKSDVKKVYALRSVIAKMLCMPDVNPHDVFENLKDCAASKMYVLMPQGQKIIAMALTLDVNHVADIHRVIKCQLATCSPDQSVGYGKAYFDAWMHAVNTSESLKNELEITCLQDLIMLAIHSRDSMLVYNTRKLLGQIHCHRKNQDVARLRYFMYQPLLWRDLKQHADGYVRANACDLFLELFPIEDPEMRVVATDIELNEQFLMIQDLLYDSCPLVRSNAILGVCIAMSVNWEIFPAERLRTLFKIIVKDLSCDLLFQVRLSVAKGMTVLLENPLTFTTLAKVLPKLLGLFHDVSRQVRMVFCQLLLRVKNIAFIKYIDIVPLNHLLARLENDCHAVTKAIVNLIHNSFFPKDKEPRIWLVRCIELLKINRGAAGAFFKHVSCFMNLESTVKFMIEIVEIIHIYVRSKLSSKTANSVRSQNNIENIESLKRAIIKLEGIGLNNPNIVSCLLNAVFIMWDSVTHELKEPKNKYYLNSLVSNLTQCLGVLSLYYKNSPVLDNINQLKKLIPSPDSSILCFVK